MDSRQDIVVRSKNPETGKYYERIIKSGNWYRTWMGSPGGSEPFIMEKFPHHGYQIVNFSRYAAKEDKQLNLIDGE